MRDQDGLRSPLLDRFRRPFKVLLTDPAPQFVGGSHLDMLCVPCARSVQQTGLRQKGVIGVRGLSRDPGGDDP